MVIHPGHNGKTFENDIAILLFEVPFENTPTVKPICLWNKDSSFEQTITNYGIDDTMVSTQRRRLIVME
jgi:hypothetical protein